MSANNYKAIKIDLTEKQAFQALKGKRINIKPEQINRGSVFVSLHPENAKKVETAFLKKRGTNVYLSHGELLDTCSKMQGSGFWGNVWKALKTGWNALKKSGVLTAAADAAIAPLSALTGQPALVTGARQLLKQTTGVGVSKRMCKSDKCAQLKAAGIYLS